MSLDRYIQGKFRGLDSSARLNGTDSSEGRRGAKGLWDQHHQLAADKLADNAVDQSEPLYAPSEHLELGKASQKKSDFFSHKK